MTTPVPGPRNRRACARRCGCNACSATFAQPEKFLSCSVDCTQLNREKIAANVDNRLMLVTALVGRVVARA